jgi:5-formyltetrahydrofolate cyclo-ligase
LTSLELEKNRLRRQLRQARNALDPAWREAASRCITDRFLAWNRLLPAEVVHTYLAWRGEVATAELVVRLLGVGKKVAVPKVNILHHVLENFYIQELNDAVPGAFGISEPDPLFCKEARIEDLQLIIVPGVAFDRAGNRIGSGHGYYDRFLSQTSAPRVGLAFRMQIIEKIPAGSHDQKMDFIVTEDEIIDCARQEKR